MIDYDGCIINKDVSITDRKLRWIHHKLQWIHHKLRCIHHIWYNGYIINYDVSIIFDTNSSYKQYIILNQKTLLRFVNKYCKMHRFATIRSPKRCIALAYSLLCITYYRDSIGTPHKYILFPRKSNNVCKIQRL